MNEVELRRWAIEQAARLHEKLGSSADVVLAYAGRLLAWIKNSGKAA